MTEDAMKFEWFEQHYIDGGCERAEAEIRRVAMTGRMLDGGRQKPIHIDEFGRLVDLLAESPRPEVQRVISRSFSIMLQCKLKEPTEEDLSRETQRILTGLEAEAVETADRVALGRKIRRQLHAVYGAGLGSSPNDSVRFLRRTLGFVGAKQLVSAVMGVTW